MVYLLWQFRYKCMLFSHMVRICYTSYHSNIHYKYLLRYVYRNNVWAIILICDVHWSSHIFRNVIIYHTKLFKKIKQKQTDKKVS